MTHTGFNSTLGILAFDTWATALSVNPYVCFNSTLGILAFDTQGIVNAQDARLEFQFHARNSGL